MVESHVPSNNVVRPFADEIDCDPLDTPFSIRDFRKSRCSRTAILCCSHNGKASLWATLIAARRQADVYLYDDASTDNTSGIGIKLGIPTVSGEVNIGKARGIRRMLDVRFASLGNRRIPEVYEFVMILDDDTILSPHYVKRMQENFDNRPQVAVHEGRLVSAWKPDQRTNGYIAARSFTSWAVHILLTWVQSILGARTWVNGAIAIYRAEILDGVVRRDPKFITEDNDWCWQIYRKKLGKIKFEYKLTAKLQEPQTFKDLYSQHLRWNWGMFQVAREHKTGLRVSRPDCMFAVLMIITIYYIFQPAFLLATMDYSFNSLKIMLIYFVARYVAFAIIGSIVSKQWRHLFLWPYFIVYDLNWRIAVVHGFIKAIRKPVLDHVVWVSPTRSVDTEQQYAA